MVVGTNFHPSTHGCCLSWQLSLAQAELQSQWEAKCEQLLASAKDEHLQQYQEVCAQRDAHQQKLSRLQDEVLSLSQLNNTRPPGCRGLVQFVESRQAVLIARKHSQGSLTCSQLFFTCLHRVVGQRQKSQCSRTCSPAI